MGERKLNAVLFVLAFALVLMLGFAGTAFAVNTHTVSVEFYDYDETALAPYSGTNTQLYVYLEITDKTSGERVGWNFQQFDPRTANPTVLNFSSFRSTTDPYGYQNPTIQFDSDRYEVTRARLYSTAPNYHLVREDLQSYEKRPDDTVDGTKFMGTETSAAATVMKLKKWNGSHLFIDFNFDPEMSTEIASGDGYWVRAELTHTTGAPTYFVAPLVTDGENILRIEANEWRDNQNYNVIDHEKFTGNEPTVNVQIIKARSGQNPDAVNVAKLNRDYVEVVAEGSAVKDYNVSYPDGTLTIEDRKIDDNTNHITSCVYNINLTKQTLEDALDPEDILGEAAEYGIVANRYDQFGHTETNFAVNHFFDNGSNIDIDGSGNTPIPFYVGDITNTAEDGTVSNPARLWISDKTSIDVDVYMTPEDITAGKLHDTTHDDIAVNTYPTEQSVINAYVNGLIQAGKATSASLAAQTNLKPVFDGSNYTVDTTGFEDGTTIYVDADGILNAIGAGGWHINKLPNQSIVFNINAESNTTVTDTIHGETTTVPAIQIAKFTVNPNDGGNEVESTTSAMDGDPALNQRVDDVIFSHITFNVTNADRVHLDNVSGLFLLPEADRVTQSNGAGWILAEGTVDSHAEWHFYRHNRNYSAKGDFTLRTQKKLLDGTGLPIPYEDKKFRFELHQSDENGTVGSLIEKTIADASDGVINFHSIKFTEEDVPVAESPKDFYYVLVEVIPDDAKNADGVRYDEATDEQKAAGGFMKYGIAYSAEPILVKVTATNTPAEGETEGVITVAVEVDGTPVQGTEDEHPVFDLGAISKTFINSKSDSDNAAVRVAGGKVLTGRSLTTADKWTFILAPDPRNPDAPMPQTTYQVACPAGTAQGAVCVQNTLGTFTFDNIVFTAEHLGENNTPATYFYQVTETGSVDHVTNTTGTKSFSVTISADERTGKIIAVTDPENLGTVLTFTNHYYADGSVVLGALKTMNLWPSGTPSFDFTLTPLNEAAVNKFGSDPLTASATEANPTAKFSALTFTYDDVANSPFTFTVKEVDPCGAADHVCNGVTYSTVEKTVSLALTANDTTGKIDVAVTSGGTAVPLDNAIYKVGDFANSYDTTDTTFTLKGYKQINDADGDTTEERTFTFELRYKSAAAGSAALATTDPVTVADGSTVEFSFAGITYSRESLAALVNARQATRATVNGKLTWTIPYVLTETVTTDKALKPNIQTFDVTVTVVDDGLGNLTCSASPDEAVLTFINNERNDVSVSVSGGKVLTGRELTAEDKWYFAITSSTTGAPMPDPAGKVTCPAGVPAGAVCVQNNVGTFTFEDIVFTPQHLGDNATAKTYRYAVTEYGHVDNVTNTTGSKEFTVTVSVDTTTGNLKAAADPSNLGELLTFTNRYYAEGAMVLAARKLMTGNLWPTGTTSFDFTLTGTNDAANAKIEEIAGAGVYKITAPATQANPTARFSEIDFTLEDVVNSPFNFTITEVVPCDAADNVCNGVTYSTKTYNVVVTLAADETTGKVVPTVTADGTTIPLANAIYTVGDFTNTYTTTDTTFTLAASKRVADTDGDTTEERTFTFELRYKSAAAGSAALATTDPVTVADGSTVEFSFDGIRYTREILTAMVNAGTASRNTVDGKLTWTIPYVLTETATTDKGIKPNTQSFPVTVTVVDDGLGKLTCTSSPAKTELLFVNNERNDVKIPISGTKSLPERALKDTDKWTFTITSSTEGAPLPDPAAVQNTGSAFTFGNITFTPQHLGENNSAKTYRYKVTETGSVDHVTNTTGAKEFTVTVSVDPSTGNLRAVSDPTNLGSLLTFVNHYYEDGSVVFGALKTMTGNLWPTGTTSYDFKLTPLNDAAKTKIAEAGITASATQANPTAIFSALTFTKEDLDIDPFEFMVEEVAPCNAANHVCNGVTYSIEKFIILVGLAHSETDGKIVPTITSNGTTIPLENAIYKVGDFANTYNTSDTTFTLEASKKINDADGDTTEERSFTFELRYPNAAAGSPALYSKTISIKDGETQEFAFDGIKYDRAILADLVDSHYATRATVAGKLTWTISYVLTEKATTDKGMNPNTQSFPITVTVTDDGLGNLTCTSSPSKATLAFVNTERDDVEVEVSGGKVLTGRTITDSDKWTFTITSTTEGAPLPNPARVTNTLGTFTFGKIVFTPQHLGENGAEKTYRYSVTESGFVDHVTNTTGAKEFTVTVSVDTNTGNLKAVTDPANLGEILSFINHYYADGDVVLGARKLMTNNLWPTGTPSFDFTLTASNDAAKEKFGEEPVTASSTQANPIARFRALTFTIDDVAKSPFNFIVKEVVPTDTKGVTYSTEEYEVSISLKADETTGKITPTITSDGDSVPLENAIYTVGDFTNTYTTSSTSFKIAASKQVNDVDSDTDETRTFTFELRYANDSAESDPRYTKEISIKDGETAEFSFDEITITRDILTAMVNAGQASRTTVDGKLTWTIRYVLKETATTDKAMKPNTQTFNVTVTVTDNGEGALSCTVSPDKTSLLFMNNERNNVNIAVSGGKRLTGRSLTENDKWTFTISSETEGAPLPDPASVTNSFGTFTFGNITFTPQHLGDNNAEKVYTYKVTESGSVTSVTNDTEAEKTFTVRVFVDPSTGNLRAAANPTNLGQLLTFTNAYHETGSVQLAAAKSMNVSPWPSAVDSFTFLLKGGNAKSIAKVGEDGITASATEENPKAVFEAITFTEDDMEDKDPYIFTITEVVPSETNGITYSDKTYTAEVTLSDDGLGHIIPLVTVNGQTKSAENNVFTVGDFANTYKAEGSFKLEGTKAVEDKDGNKGESRTFTFSLRYKGDTASDPVMTGTVTLNDGGTADITFTPAEVKLDTELLAELVEDGKATLDSTGEKPVWTILYTLTEDATGYADIVLNEQEIEVTVTVTDNGDGTLACEVKPAKADIAFVNEERGSAEIGITGGKKLEGRALTENDKWTFTISSETEGAPLPDPASVTNTLGTFSFDSIVFGFEHLNPDGSAKTYTYTVTETGSVDSVTNDAEASRIFTVTVSRNADGEIQVVTDPEDLGELLTFTNTYTANGQLVLRSSKHIVDADDDKQESHVIPFELWYKSDYDLYKDGDTEVKPFIVEDVTIYDDGTTEFTYPLVYTLESPADPAQTPEGAVRVSLPELKEAGMATEKIVDGKSTWTVEYVLDEKTVIDQQLKPPDQTFDVVVTLTDNGAGTLEVTSVKEKNINHPEEAFVEIDPEEDEFRVGQFVNKERLDSAPVVIGGVKQLEGRDLTEDDTWTFTIEAVDGGPLPDPATVTNKNGSFSFAPIVFSAHHLGECYYTEDGSYHCGSKVYNYRVIESGKVSGVTNDEPKTFKVTVSLDENGNVQADADPADLGEIVTFTNKYEAAADIQFTAAKTLNGGNLTAGQFTFVLTLPDGTTETASNDAKGLVTFSRISYTLDDAGKTYTYKVQEVIPENPDPDITYDTTVHTITVSLENDGKGGLTRTVTVDGREVAADGVRISVGDFINDQSGTSDKVNVRLGGTKMLKNWKKSELPHFTFLLFEDGKEIARTSTEGSGTYSFYLTYDEPGTHVYTVREEAGDNKDVIYDTREYTVTVTITADPAGKLSAEISGDDPEKLDFVNKGRIVRTGFSAIRPTVLPDMPLDLSYKPMHLTLQIPSLELTTEIVGVPEVDGEHPVTWLGDNAGLLEGYGQPGDGRMYLAGHNHLSDTEAGPFAFLMWMEEGDRIFVTDQNNGLQLYTVYANEKIDEDDVDGLDRISMEYENSITLITCEDEYEPGHYLSRRIIAARPL